MNTENITNFGEFEDWLRKGLGRAVLRLHEHPSPEYYPLILKACTKNLSFDSQTEHSRELFLWDLIQNSGDPRVLRDALLQVLNQATDTVDLDQLIAVLKFFAQQGDLEVREAMYTAVTKAGFTKGGSCFTDLIALDGADGLRAAAKTLSVQVEEGDLWIISCWLDGIEQNDQSDSAKAVINMIAEEFPIFQSAITLLQETYKPNMISAPVLSAPYAELQIQLNKSMEFRNLTGWAMNATEDDLLHAANDLLVQTHRNLIRSYLTIFRKVQFTGPIGMILELARSEDVPVTRAAVTLLSQLSDPRIRKLALEMAESPHRRGDAIELLIGTFQEGDFSQIEDWARSTHDPHELHSIGMAVRHLVQVHKVPSAITSLLFLYEKGPCSLCRGHIVEHLIALSALPDWMRWECAFDSDPDTRKLVDRRELV